MKNIALFLLLFSFLASCTSRNDNSTPTYLVENKDFVNSIEIEGIVEPVDFTTIALPQNFEGTIGYLIEDGVFVKTGDLVCAVEVPEIQTNYDQMLIDLEKGKAEFEKRKVEMNLEYAMLQSQVQNNEANSKISELDSLQLQYSPQTQRKITQLELKKVEIEKKRFEKKLKTMEIIHQSEIRKLEVQIQRQSNQAQSLKENLEALNLKAPKDGLAIRGVNFLTGSKFKVGDPVWGGMNIVSIPGMKQMKVKLQTMEPEFKIISVNDSVSYVFDAMEGNSGYGKITKKTPVGQQYKEQSNVKFFEIEASVDSCLSLPEPGFTARCKIILSQIRDTIVVPQISVFDYDSTKVVYVKRKNRFDIHEVKTGAASAKEIIITEGLKKNDVISLGKPRESAVKNKIFFPKGKEPDSTKAATPTAPMLKE